jgi:hypothetical protein
MVLYSFTKASRVRGILDQATFEMENLIPILKNQVHTFENEAVILIASHKKCDARVKVYFLP